MSASDFDDIFGDDVKMDATTAPTLTNVSLDDAELFGGDTTGKVSKPVSEQPAQGSNWEQIGSQEQDEFLSWLDDGGASKPPSTGEASIPENSMPSVGSSPPTAPVGPSPVLSAAPSTFDNVSLDESDDFDRMLDAGNTLPTASVSEITPVPGLSRNNRDSNEDDDVDRMLNASTAEAASEMTASPAVVQTKMTNSDDLDQMLESASAQASTDTPTQVNVVGSISLDDDLEKIVQNASKHSGASVFVSSTSVGNISLDDDDDDDLEQIVQKANKQANVTSSRENSSSSLQIKSQVQAQHKAQQIGTKICLNSEVD
ncbi:unnamed protein product [Phytophthora fragariaefolia]|uniref:Unnamed protein product n=1 Tax=Phytophthora fragariaefolia TaxID=1490495 RepID=A0A9W6XCJ4_9STRA|nr:unnamed protein product [Phytophthora fragariaefolia]